MKLRELVEANQLANYITLCNELGYFMTLNATKLNSYGKDADAARELSDMMAQFRKPVLNGKTITDLLGEINLVTLKNPKVIPHILKWAYQFINYVKPRIEKYTNEAGRKAFGGRIEQISNIYKAAVKDLS